MSTRRLSALSAFALAAFALRLKAQQQPRGFPATADVVMRVYVPKGKVSIRTWTRDSIAISGTMGKNASFFGGGDRAHVKLGIEPLRVNDPTLPSAEFEVTVPRGARLWVKMIDGELSVTGTTTELEAYAVTGRITVRDVAGVTSIESIDAPVEVFGAKGDLRVRGSKGGVRLDDVSGTVSVGTISGPVALTRFRADARVETIGGEVSYAGGALPGALLDVQTHNGAITLTLDPINTPQLDLSSRTGAVAGAKASGAADNGRIVVRSFKGAITVQRALKVIAKEEFR